MSDTAIEIHTMHPRAVWRGTAGPAMPVDVVWIWPDGHRVDIKTARILQAYRAPACIVQRDDFDAKRAIVFVGWEYADRLREAGRRVFISFDGFIPGWSGAEKII